MAIKDTLEKAAGFKVWEIPEGYGLALCGADAVTTAGIEALGALLGRFGIPAPKLVAGHAICAVNRKWIKSERYVGPLCSSALDGMLVKNSWDLEVRITERIADGIRKITGGTVAGFGKAKQPLGEEIVLGTIETRSSPIGEIALSVAELLELQDRREKEWMS